MRRRIGMGGGDRMGKGVRGRVMIEREGGRG
jgi:hypothetical protein